MSAKPRGPWLQRFLINFFTLVMAVLVYWALGFVVDDIGSVEGPVYRDVETRYVDSSMSDRSKELAAEISSTDRAIAAKREEMRIISDSSTNLQGTINQLIELRKLSIQKSTSPGEEDSLNLSGSLAGFLESQRQYQAHNAELSKLSERKRALEAERSDLDKKIDEQKIPARREYQELAEKHRLRMAAWQLAVILPLLGAGAWMAAKKRGSVYFPVYLAFGGAVFLKAVQVIHNYFPTRYFKYAVVLGLLLVVVKTLTSLIKIAAFPKARWLTKQYREAYERFLCPVCEYPIRTGPRKYLYWTRRTVNKIPLSGDGAEEKPYTCPDCGTSLFEPCEACGGLRHSLLPFCRHCGAEKKITGSTAGDQEK